MKLSAVCVAASTISWALTTHPLLFVAIGVSVGCLLVATDRANQRDMKKLARYRHPGGDR